MEIKNYRPFPVDLPARFSLGHGFTAVVGPNNAGKSSLLRFFYEFRNYWARLNRPTGNILGALTAADGDGAPNFLGVRDQDEVFSALHDRGIEIRLTLSHDYEQPEGTPLEERHMPIPRQLLIKIQRDGRWTLAVSEPADAIESGDLSWHSTLLQQSGTPILEFSPWFELFEGLQRALYVGPFRNALNAGASEYYDLNVGTAFIRDWNTFRSGNVKAQNLAALHLTDEIRRIFGLEQLDIAASEDDTTLQLIVDNQPYRLDEVGGGLTHFIVVLAYAATRRPGLHPHRRARAESSSFTSARLPHDRGIVRFRRSRLRHS